MCEYKNVGACECKRWRRNKGHGKACDEFHICGTEGMGHMEGVGSIEGMGRHGNAWEGIAKHLKARGARECGGRLDR